MLSSAEITNSNTLCADSPPTGLVCVFAGGTGRIGGATLDCLGGILRDSVFYVLGRSSSRFLGVRQRLEEHGRGNRAVFLQTDLTLLSSIDATCDEIATKEKKVDVLFLSQGMPALEEVNPTIEGLHPRFMLSYCGRMRLVYNFLPKLHLSGNPRVLSVLTAGHETRLAEDEISLTDKSSLVKPFWNAPTLQTLAFDYLADQTENEHIVFMHVHPGVSADVFKNAPFPERGLLEKMYFAVLERIMWAAMWVALESPKQCGQRQAFHLTDERFKPGSLRLWGESDEAPLNDVLEEYRSGNWPVKVWDFTVEAWNTVNISSEKPKE